MWDLTSCDYHVESFGNVLPTSRRHQITSEADFRFPHFTVTHSECFFWYVWKLSWSWFLCWNVILGGICVPWHSRSYLALEQITFYFLWGETFSFYLYLFIYCIGNYLIAQSIYLLSFVSWFSIYPRWARWGEISSNLLFLPSFHFLISHGIQGKECWITSQDSDNKQKRRGAASQTKAKGKKQMSKRQVGRFRTSFLVRQEWASEQREIMD